MKTATVPFIMAAKKKTAKKTKKFEYTRAQISGELASITDRFGDIDTYAMSPDDVAEALNQIVNDLENATNDLNEKKCEAPVW